MLGVQSTPGDAAAVPVTASVAAVQGRVDCSGSGAGCEGQSTQC